MTREAAVAQLEALGVPFGQSGDVADLKRHIVARTSKPLAFNPHKQCLRKRKHSTRDEALTVIRRMGNVYLSEYPCVYCKGWHVGNAPRAIVR